MKSASVIITSYNYGRFLRETINSALAQIYPQTEVVIVDDGSRDNSRARPSFTGSDMISSGCTACTAGTASRISATITAIIRRIGSLRRLQALLVTAPIPWS